MNTIFVMTGKPYINPFIKSGETNERWSTYAQHAVIKHWGLSCISSFSLAGKFINSWYVRNHGFHKVSYRQTLTPTIRSVQTTGFLYFDSLETILDGEFYAEK
jgi:hypothetical protein